MQAHYLLVSLSGHVRSALCERSRILQKKRALKIGDFASSEVQRWVVTKSGLTTLATRAETIRACRPPPTGRRRHGMGTEKQSLTVADTSLSIIVVDHCRTPAELFTLWRLRHTKIRSGPNVSSFGSFLALYQSVLKRFLWSAGSSDGHRDYCTADAFVAQCCLPVCTGRGFSMAFDGF